MLNESELRYRHNRYPITFLLYDTLFIVRHENKVATIQFFSTLNQTINFPIFGSGASHVITYLYQKFYLGSFP